MSELLAAVENVIHDIAELPDRNSPADQPEMMIVSADELREIILRHLDGGYLAAEAEVKRLRERIALHGPESNYKDLYEQAERRTDDLRDALKRYGSHRGSCDLMRFPTRHYDESVCTCGYAELGC